MTRPGPLPAFCLIASTLSLSLSPPEASLFVHLILQIIPLLPPQHVSGWNLTIWVNTQRIDPGVSSKSRRHSQDSSPLPPQPQCGDMCAVCPVTSSVIFMSETLSLSHYEHNSDNIIKLLSAPNIKHTTLICGVLKENWHQVCGPPLSSSCQYIIVLWTCDVWIIHFNLFFHTSSRLPQRNGYKNRLEIILRNGIRNLPCSRLTYS